MGCRAVCRSVRRPLTVALGVAMCFASSSAWAQPVLVQTSSLSLRDDVVEPILADSRKLLFRSSTRRDPLANAVQPPAPAGPGDPTLGGATLALYNPASGECTVACLEPQLWEQRGTAERPDYRYRALDVKISSVSVKADRLMIRGGGPSLDYTLNETAQGAIVLRLQLGTGLALCAEASARTLAPRRDVPGRFAAQARTPYPPDCPSVPVSCAPVPAPCPPL